MKKQPKYVIRYTRIDEPTEKAIVRAAEVDGGRSVSSLIARTLRAVFVDRKGKPDAV